MKTTKCSVSCVITAIGILFAQWGGADYIVIDLSAGPDADHYPVTQLSEAPAGGWTDEYKTTSLVLRHIPAGTFTMGSPPGEIGRVNAHEAQRDVTLTQDFYIGVFQVTQRQWERVMGDWPSWYTNVAYRDSRPVEYVTWDRVRGGDWPGEPVGSGRPASDTFVDRISRRTGLSLDLPTEAQWEYACRAGTTTALNSGYNLTFPNSNHFMCVVGRYAFNHPVAHSPNPYVDTGGGTATVGSYQPNAWGLYDMHGNVSEYCLDWFQPVADGLVDPVGPATGTVRVIRGGREMSFAFGCRSAFRDSADPSTFTHRQALGFRLVSMETPLPTIALSETTFSWSIPQWTAASPQPFTVTISSNAPIATAPYWFSPQHDWLQITPAAGTLTNNMPRTITLQPHVAHLDPGTYTNIVTFVSPYLDVSPLQIEAVVSIESSATAPRGVRMVSGVNGAAGHVLTVPIELVSTGDVNAVGFSLEFDRNVFANPVVEVLYSNNAPTLIENLSNARNGRIGIMLGLEPWPVPHGFTAGTQALLQVTFELNDRAIPGYFPVTFADSVVIRQFASTHSETAVLPGAWASARVLVHGGYEAGVPANRSRDYEPSPDITAEDWVRVGRLVAGLDSVRNAADFQVADCAPMATRGDGVLSLADWVQAGIYYVTTPLANVVMGAGPSAPVPGVVFPQLEGMASMADSSPSRVTSQSTSLTAPASIHLCTDLDIAGDTMPPSSPSYEKRSRDDGLSLQSSSTRRLQAVQASHERGRMIEVPIRFNALGTENSVHFTLDFDSDVLEFQQIRRGGSATSAILLSNQDRVSEGHVGVALTLQPGARFPAGEHVIAYVEFYARAGAASMWTRIRLSDEVLPRKVLSDTVVLLPTTYADTHLLLEPTAAEDRPVLGLRSAEAATLKAGIQWDASAGRRYAIYRSTNLVTGGFQKIAGGIQADGEILHFDDPDAVGPGLYIYRIAIE